MSTQVKPIGRPINEGIETFPSGYPEYEIQWTTTAFSVIRIVIRQIHGLMQDGTICYHWWDDEGELLGTESRAKALVILSCHFKWDGMVDLEFSDYIQLQFSDRKAWLEFVGLMARVYDIAERECEVIKKFKSRQKALNGS